MIDAHTHLMQDVHDGERLPRSVGDIPGLDLGELLAGMDRVGLSHVVTLSQEMTRVRDQWLGSNELAADLQARSGGRLLALASFEPITPDNRFNDRRFGQVREMVQSRAVTGLLITPPYGHFELNDRRAYPFYQLAAEAEVPVFVHLVHHAEDPGRANPAPGGGPAYATRLWRLEQVAADFPQLRFNIEHMADPWMEDLLAIMPHCGNVWTDITKITARPGIAAWLHLAREQGFLDRVFWGTDYVGTDIDEYLEWVTSGIDWTRNQLDGRMADAGFAPLGEVEIDGLLRGNAGRFLGSLLTGGAAE